MRLHRFIGSFNLAPNKTIVIKEKELIEQIKKVLRLKIGDKIILCDGLGTEAEALILRLDKDIVEVEIKSLSKTNNEPTRQVTLYCAILKRENFELAAQKATEVGVSAIVPLITERTVKLDIKADRLRKIIKEAAEQSGRGVVPALLAPLKLEQAIAQAKTKGQNFWFSALGEPPPNPLLSTGGGTEKTSPPVLRRGLRGGLFIGPEGGWTEAETQAAKSAGFKVVSLGPLTLRAETAAIVASYLITSC